MKNIKFILAVIIIGFIILCIIQNLEVLKAKVGFTLDLFLIDEYKTPELPNVVLYIFFALIGFIVSYILNMAELFKSRKKVKNINLTLASQAQETNELRNELDALKASCSKKHKDKEADLLPV